MKVKLPLLPRCKKGDNMILYDRTMWPLRYQFNNLKNTIIIFMVKKTIENGLA
jgi:hypothetical protein